MMIPWRLASAVHIGLFYSFPENNELSGYVLCLKGRKRLFCLEKKAEFWYYRVHIQRSLQLGGEGIWLNFILFI
jgi:hypothetical protein